MVKGILADDNRNLDAPDSLEAVIRDLNRPESLPVFTISNLNSIRTNRTYAKNVLKSVYDYLIRIDELRGTGRLYLPHIHWQNANFQQAGYPCLG